MLLAAAIAWAVAHGRTMAADMALLRAIAGPVAAAPDWRAVAWGVTRLGDPATRYLMTAAAVLVLAMGRRDPVGAAVLAGTSLLANLVNSELKLWVARPRPALLPRLDHVTTLSFPSGHAANSATLYLLAALLFARTGRGRWAVPVAAALVAAIGLSRVALAVHWPSDVAAGWCLGAAWALAGRALADAADPKRRARG